MAIANYKPDQEPVVEPNLPIIQPENYESIIYSDSNIPLQSLLAYVGGAPWIVDYYQQVVSRDNDLREVDPSQPNVYQQYQKINRLELRVEDALSTSYDSDTSITSVSGTAVIYSFILPNAGDYFITDAGNTRKGIFKINNVERLTFNRDSSFKVDYTMVGYVEVIQDIYNDLESKVIRNYYFSKDRLIEGLSPILKTEDYYQIGDLKSTYRDLVDYYFRTFYAQQFRTLVLPGQVAGMYDGFIMEYIKKIIGVREHPNLKFIQTLTNDNDPYLKQDQFWRSMLYKDYDGLSQCNQKMKLADKRLFNPNTFMTGLAYTNISYVVYPDGPDLTTIISEKPSVKELSMEEAVEVSSRNGTLAELINDQYVDVNQSYPFIKTVLYDDYYVLSSDFYNETSQQSLLEILTKDYMKQNTIDLVKLTALCNKAKSWGRLEQFYYFPILFTLIKESDRSTYS